MDAGIGSVAPNVSGLPRMPTIASTIGWKIYNPYRKRLRFKQLIRLKHSSGSGRHQATMTVTTYKWTIDRYHQAIDAGIFAGQAIELLKGELVQMPPEGIAHAGLSSNGADYLREMLGSQVKVREAKPISLLNASEPEPDIAIVQPIPEIYATTRHPNVDDIFWVIEYSNTSLLKDLEVKRQIYAEAGIVEYWVVNLKTRELIIFRDPVNGDYQSEVSLNSGTIAPLAFPATFLAVRKFIG